MPEVEPVTMAVFLVVKAACSFDAARTDAYCSARYKSQAAQEQRRCRQ
jgi:hypothetical protein